MKRVSVCLVILCFMSLPAAAQSLVCRVIHDGQAQWGNDGDKHHAKSTATIPESLWKAGYRVTGGGCDPTPVHTGEGYGSVISIPSQRDYTCKHVVAEPSGAAVRASVVACRIAVDPVDPPSPVQTWDGNDMIVARRGVSFLKPLNYDYKLCNTDKANGLSVKWTDKSHHRLTNPQFLEKTVPAGSCIEFGNATSPDRATSITMRATTGSPQAGYFARYPLGTFAEVGSIDSTPPDETNVPPPVSHPADAKFHSVRCTSVSPKPSDSGEDTVFVKQCQLPVPDWGHYRICFDDQYAELIDGTLSEWPATALPIVLDKRVIGLPSPPNSADPIRNWIFPRHCRDYYDVQAAYVLVGYRAKDSNFAPGAIWDPNKVSKVRMWIAPLKKPLRLTN